MQSLADRISAEIDALQGWMPFDRYMQLVLYEPGLGYYTGPATKLGPQGDFTTAPELGTLLADALFEFLSPQLAAMASPALLELGAGTGSLALQLLERLQAAGLDRVRYLILEPSPDLAARQRGLLDGYRDRVEWLRALPPAPIEAIVVANEVADALPVQVFEKVDGAVLPLGVACDAGRFVWRSGARDERLSTAVARIERSLGAALPDGYRSELSPTLPAWIASLADVIATGGMLLIDYGLPRREYYHPQRSAGTLICHRRHRAHGDPLRMPGLQDISAWVDFSAVAEAGRNAGLTLAGYTTQGQFLIEHLGRADPAVVAALPTEVHSAIKTLVLPGEMGEGFKLAWLTRGHDTALPGRDLRDRL